MELTLQKVKEWRDQLRQAIEIEIDQSFRIENVYAEMNQMIDEKEDYPKTEEEYIAGC